jgi:hypothetical protein
MVQTAVCTDLVASQLALHVANNATGALTDTNIIAAYAGDTVNTNHNSPTDWVPLCYKFRDDSSVCTAITGFSFDTSMTSACITKVSTNKLTDMCVR